MGDQGFDASRRVAAAVCAAGLLLATDAAAQAVRYADLEELFGEPVTLSATGKPQRAADVPVAMEIITQDEIRRSGAADIPDVLRQFAAIDVQRWSTTAVDVGVRGYNQPYSPRLLVLVNGRQVYLDHYSTTAWAAVPVELSEIRQIEVVKGPNAALFGFNAVSGVINIITANPLYDRVNRVEARVGTQERRELSAVATFKPAESVGVRLSAGGLRARDFNRGLLPVENRLRRESERMSVSGDLRAQLFDNVQWGLELTRTEVEQAEFLPFYAFASTGYRTSSIKSTLLAETDWGLTDFTFYTNWLQTTISTAIGAFPRVDLSQQVTVAKVDHLYKISPSHTVRGSLEYRHNRANTGPVSGGDVSYNVYAAGLMWDWQITDTFALTNAARLDHLKLERGGSIAAGLGQTNANWDRDITEPSFNAAAVWKASPKDTLRASYGRGAQVPSLVEFGSASAVNASPRFALVGNPRLDPTIVSNYEIGYDRQLDEIRSTLRASVFYQLSTDVKGFPSGTPPVLPPTSAFPVFLWRNIGESDLYGLEIGLRNQRGTTWRWGLDYAWLRVDDRFSTNQSGVPTNPTDYENSTPRHVVTGRIGWGDETVEADLYVRYTSAIDMLRSTGVTGGYRFDKIDDVVTLSGRVAWKPAPWLTAALTGATLNAGRQRETSGPEMERRVLVTLSVDY